jgi:hypothetical protein
VDLIDSAAMDWGANLAAQRSAGMAHKRLFEGEEGSPDNYLLVLADERSTYFSPRHRHAWDQVRYCLEGAVPVGKGIAVEAGEVAYFPEGAAYGPQQGGPDRIELLLQFGGASGQGYIGADRLDAARAEMSAFGRFEKGVFIRTDGRGRKNQDAYEAIWEHVTGRPILYPEPAYPAPVIVRPDSIAWQVEPEPGLAKKVVGLFAHRGLAVTLVRVDADRRWQLIAEGSLRLLFVTDGEGSIGDAHYRPQTAIRLAPDENTTLAATTRTEFLMLSIAPVHSLCR